MAHRSASILSVTLSLLLLLIFGALISLFEIIVLNGASERQGLSAIRISLPCLGVGAILLGILAWKSTGLLLTRFNLGPILAITLTVAPGIVFGGAMGFLSILSRSRIIERGPKIGVRAYARTPIFGESFGHGFTFREVLILLSISATGIL